MTWSQAFLVVLLATGCTHRLLEGSTKKSAMPAQVSPPRPPPVRRVVVARVCPDGVGDSELPEAQLLAARTDDGWTQRSADLAPLIHRARLGRLAVLAWDGKRSGAFTVAGAAGIAGQTTRATGGFAGRGPCQAPPLSGTPVDPACTATLVGCGVGLGQIDPPDLDDSPVPAIHKVCQAGGALVVDVDGDSSLESFALAAFARQDEEIAGVAHRGACAEPAFARARLDERLDLLGAADLDGDGRAEIVLQLRGRKTRWLVYSPGQAAARLERVAAVEISGGALP